MTTSISPALPERFSNKFVVLDTGCWHWTAGLQTQGYGAFCVDGAMRLAHRFAYETLVGPIPVGLDLDHLCRNRRCCNPKHLEPVTRAENIARGDGPTVSAERAAARTRCTNGHALTDDNVAQRTDHPGRRCRACARDAAARYRARKAVS